MTQERYAFLVVTRAADYVMEQRLDPTDEGHDLSFAGQLIQPYTKSQLAALNIGRSLGLNKLTTQHLGVPTTRSYHDKQKVGKFFEIIIPGDSVIEPLNHPAEANFVIKSYAELMTAYNDGRLQELSQRYTRGLIAND